MPELRESRTVVCPETGVRIRTLTGRTILRLKAWVSGTSWPYAEPPEIAGHELPSKVGTSVRGELRVLCTGPSDWLVVAGGTLLWPARGAIEAHCARQSLAMVDLSSGLCVIEVAGSRARELLSKGCGLDLDRRAFLHPRCARTRFAQLAVTIDALEETDGFELYVASSHAQYLNEWLTAAMREFS